MSKIKVASFFLGHSVVYNNTMLWYTHTQLSNNQLHTCLSMNAMISVDSQTLA